MSFLAENETETNEPETTGDLSSSSEKAVAQEKADLSGVDVTISVSTDKEEYTSYEEIKIVVSAVSSKEIENATVKVWGITPYSRNHIESEKKVQLNEGETVIEFTETAPACTSGCGGVFPGPYNIKVLIQKDETELANAKTGIVLTN
jgi:hypothetical protein